MPNFAHLVVRRLLAVAEGRPVSGKICIGGMITHLLYHLNHTERLDGLAPVPGGHFLERESLSRANIVKYPVCNRRVFWVLGGAWCYLPCGHLETPFDDPEVWHVPKQDVHPDHQGRASVRIEEVEAALERQHGPRRARRPAPHAGTSGASTSAAPQDPFDVSRMFSMLENIQSAQERQGHMIQGLRTQVDDVARVTFRNHRALVNAGLAPPFPNHPQYPPSYDFTPGYWQEPPSYGAPDQGTSCPPPDPGASSSYGRNGDPSYGIWGHQGGSFGGDQNFGFGDDQGWN